MEKVCLFLARGLGSGLLKPAPGTWGSLVAVIIAYFIHLPWWFILLSGVLAVYICDVAEKVLGVPDASEIVLDEFIGMWITCWAIPHHIVLYILAFALFRLFDITKVFPVDNVQSLPGGLGVVADDVVAGIMGRIVMAIVIFIWF